MGHWFDDLTITLTSGASRRHVLRTMGATVLGALVGAGQPLKAGAQTDGSDSSPGADTSEPGSDSSGQSNPTTPDQSSQPSNASPATSDGTASAPAADTSGAAQPPAVTVSSDAPPLPIPTPGPGNRVLPIFAKPFAGDFGLGNYFDHDLPFEFTDHNGYQLTWWGLKVWPAIDGHNGYDFRMPEGTPILAVAPGKVVFAGQTNPAACPILGNAVVSANQVQVEHQVNGPNGPLRIRSLYNHFSRVDVQANQQVNQGDQLGLSGTTGCSTGPHLHFGALVFQNGRFVTIDPFGWEGPTPDPWAQHPQGAPSLWLWQPASTPGIAYRDVQSPVNPTPADRAPVCVTFVRPNSWHDDTNPNNEFIELTLDPRYAPSGAYDMTGCTLQNNAGDVFQFPDGFTVQQGVVARVFMGPGENASTQLFWGRSTGAWNPIGDCVHLLHANGNNLWRQRVLGGTCG